MLTVTVVAQGETRQEIDRALVAARSDWHATIRYLGTRGGDVEGRSYVEGEPPWRWTLTEGEGPAAPAAAPRPDLHALLAAVMNNGPRPLGTDPTKRLLAALVERVTALERRGLP